MLQSTQKELATASNRVSTGLRIASAADGASYWSIATKIRSHNGALGAARDALRSSESMVDAMYRGIATTVGDLQSMLAKVTAAQQPGADLAAIQGEISGLQEKMRQTANASQFNGQNWLSVDSTPGPDELPLKRQLVAGVSGGHSGASTVTTIDMEVTAFGLFDAYTFPDNIYPAVSAGLHFDSVYWAARSINDDPELKGIVKASVVDEKLRLTSVDPTKRIVGSYATDGTTGQPGVSHPPTGDTGGFVDLDARSVANGDVVKFTIEGEAEKTFTVSGQSATLDFSDSNELRFALRPHGEKYPDVRYEVVLNKDALQGRVYDLSNVTRRELLSTMNAQIRQSYRDNYAGQYDWAQIGVGAHSSIVRYRDEIIPLDNLVFQANAFGLHSSLSVEILSPTGGNSLVDVGFGTAPSRVGFDLGYQGDTIRLRKGYLDTVAPDTGFSIAGKGTGIDLTKIQGRGDLEWILKQVGETLDKVTAAAANMGSLKQRIINQAEFTETLIRLNASSISTLVDADMEEESVRLNALQVRQQLGIQALSIANQDSEIILALFRS
jgi:flagellin